MRSYDGESDDVGASAASAPKVCLQPTLLNFGDRCKQSMGGGWLALSEEVGHERVDQLAGGAVEERPMSDRGGAEEATAAGDLELAAIGPEELPGLRILGIDADLDHGGRRLGEIEAGLQNP